MILQVCKDKRMLELLAFRVYIMLVYKNATIFNLSVEKVKELMRCTTPEAERLIEDAKQSEWFSFCKRKNSLRALSMKSQVEKLAKINLSYRSDFCFLMTGEYVSLRDMVKRLRGVIIIMIIMQASGKPSLNGANKESLPYIMIYQMTFGNKLGLSQGAVSKLVTYLNKIGWLDKTTQAFRRIKELRNSSEEEREEYRKNHHNCSLRKKTSSICYQKSKVVSHNYFSYYGLGYMASPRFDKCFRNRMWTHSKLKKAS